VVVLLSFVVFVGVCVRSCSILIWSRCGDCGWAWSDRAAHAVGGGICLLDLAYR
jgi:hypothetical protein